MVNKNEAPIIPIIYELIPKVLPSRTQTLEKPFKLHVTYKLSC